jgi:hypothetical protein
MHYVYAHLIGDYILQNDWMALNKKTKPWICAIHAITYIIPFILFCNFEIWQYSLIGLQHYIQDNSNFVVWLMKIKGSKKFAEPPCAPWPIFITDNIIHLLFIELVILMGDHFAF